MLIGLVTKNGILIVEFANQRQQAGLNKHNAIVEAAVQRLRPLMTSISTILGLLPLALQLAKEPMAVLPWVRLWLVDC